MNTDLSRFKVIYNNKVLNAVALMHMDFKGVFDEENDNIDKPISLEIIAINEDGNIIVIRDEAWRFQFLPIVKGDRP